MVASGAEYAGAGPEYAGGAAELEAELLKGSATVAGFAGRRVGALNAGNGDLGKSVGEEDFLDIFDELLGTRLNGELLLDFRRKRLNEGIDRREVVLEDDSVHKEDVESRMKGMVFKLRLSLFFGNEL